MSANSNSECLAAHADSQMKPFYKFVGADIDFYGYNIGATLTMKKALENFNKLDESEKTEFAALCNKCVGECSLGEDAVAGGRLSESGALKLSSLINILPCGESLAKSFLRDRTAQQSLEKCQFFFKVRQNFEQSYPDTCLAVSEFTPLAIAFKWNVALLNPMVEMEANRILSELSVRSEDPGLKRPAFPAHSIRSAPTIWAMVSQFCGKRWKFDGVVGERGFIGIPLRSRKKDGKF
jgi:hypothetical protein